MCQIKGVKRSRKWKYSRTENSYLSKRTSWHPRHSLIKWLMSGRWAEGGRRRRCVQDAPLALLCALRSRCGSGTRAHSDGFGAPLTRVTVSVWRLRTGTVPTDRIWKLTSEGFKEGRRDPATGRRWKTEPDENAKLEGSWIIIYEPRGQKKEKIQLTQRLIAQMWGHSCRSGLEFRKKRFVTWTSSRPEVSENWTVPVSVSDHQRLTLREQRLHPQVDNRCGEGEGLTSPISALRDWFEKFVPIASPWWRNHMMKLSNWLMLRMT